MMKQTWAKELYSFYTRLKPPMPLPDGIEWLHPQKEPEVVAVWKAFLDKFYNDSTRRRLLLGINPGRFGAGVTGVNFTAPRQLAADCGIAHPFKDQSELSAEFIYQVIQAYGGPARFYGDFFIGSVCPLGFVKNGKNINYYDDKQLLEVVEPFIVKSLEQLLALNFATEQCICIGGEKNLKFLSLLNKKHHWFEKIIAVPHPRFIMQYRRKTLPAFIQEYLQALEK